MSRSLRVLVEAQAERNPDAIAILSPGRRPLTYGRLSRHIAEVVPALNALGLGRNDRIAMVLPEGPELAVAFLAIGSGAACAPLNPAFRLAEFDRHLAQLNCRALLVQAGSSSAGVTAARARGIAILELVPEAEGEAGLFSLKPCGTVKGAANPDIGWAQPDDVALVLHTSGTAAQPKLVPLTHRNVCESAENIRAALELVERDRCLNVMPLFHIHGLSTVFSSMAAGASIICTEQFTAEQFFDSLDALRPTWYSAAPAIHREILQSAPQHPWILASSSLRLIRSASAAMPRQLIVDMERAFGVPFIEAYGMTEAAPQIASNRLPPEVRKPGSVGRAAGPDVAIMDEAGTLVPEGQDGEIVIRGPGVMSAYENNPDANNSAFVRGWFRTGDRGHLDADGSLFITGRLKEIINRGGEKISPPDVDVVLLDHPAVAQAVTFPVPHATLGEDVAAAIVLRPDVRGDGGEALHRELRQFASARLADFKVPQLVLFLDEIPKGPTGKVQRRDLAEQLGLTTPGRRLVRFVAPRTPVEARVADIWAAVLGADRPGLHDNFFQAGGDSLRAAQVISWISREFQVELPAHTLFERPTVEELAELVGERSATGTNGKRIAIPRRAGAEECPLSFAQQRLWFLDQIEPGNPAYNMSLALRLSGPLSDDALERSLGEIIRRHEALRTTFRMAGDQPVQVVSPVRALRMPVVDLTRVPASERHAEAARLASDEAALPFHLAHGPLFRVTLFRLGPEEHILLMAMHHIVSDGWSTGVLHRELTAHYPAFVAGRPSPLPEPQIQYRDFAVWQREWMQGKVLDTQLAYWKKRLERMPPVLELPADRQRPAVRSHRGASYSTGIPVQLTEALKALSRREGVTPFMTLLAALQALLHRYTGQEDVVVGTPIANRTRPEADGLIGFFANTLVMRADLSDQPAFTEALRRVKTAATGAYANQDLPFEKLVEALHPDRDPDHNPLFQVMFAFQNLPGSASPELAAGLTVTPMELPRSAAKFDLTLYLSEAGQGLTATWLYNTDLFDEPRIVRMAGHFQTMLEGIVAAPEARLSELPLVSEAERRQLLTAWNRTGQPSGDDRCFHQLFEAQVLKTPDAPAVRCGAEQLSYRELNQRANALAWRLQDMGVGPGTPVGIRLPRSAGMVVAVLAVMKAGGAYLALDPSYPPDHLSSMVKAAGVTVLLSDEDLLPVARSDRNPVSGATPDHLAYVIYTSGSTGTPKGVMITHGNLTHYVHGMGAALGIRADDRYLHTASFAFSSSVRQLALPLSCGACVVIAPAEALRDPEALFGLIKTEGVSVIDIVPSHWRICNQVLAGLPPGSRADLLANRLRLVLSASEPLLADVLAGSVFGEGVELINMYGQTETTGIVTVHPVAGFEGGSTAIVPIGRPIANTAVYVLDAARQPVPVGVWGELYVGGASVGRGYLNEPSLTADKFLPDPFSRIAGARLYRTGDVARYLTDGNLEFWGRADHQVKVRGHRVEPGQVEAAIGRHAGWRESAVVTQEDAIGERRLTAYVVPEPGARASTRALRDFLKQQLPDYMVPARIVEVTMLPRRPSGKVDRAALSAQVGEAPEPEDTPAVPVTRAEELLTGIWSQVLGVETISPDDNFFDLGGNSILSIQMITRARQAGLTFSPKQLWENQTIAELASLLAGQGARDGSGASDRVRVTIESLRAYGREALERAGLAPEGAAIVTEVQLEASLRDQPTHNMVSIPRYAKRIARGSIKARPDIRIERRSDTSAHVDGDNGPGQWVAVVAMEEAIRIAREHGMGIVGVRRSNHLGAAGHYPWLAAREGLIGLCTTNGPVILAPTGGTTPTFGNNPLAVGIPAGRHHPILLDIAMSVAPRGRIGLALAEGQALPPGWILDRHGNPSTDPADLVAGLGVPIGGHKGYGLTLIMEVLAGVLTGANFGWDNRREEGPGTAKPAGFGHFFMAIDPELFMPIAEFKSRVDRLIDQARTGARADGVEAILVPGESELTARERSLEDGVPLRESTYQALVKYAKAAGLDTELVVTDRRTDGQVDDARAQGL